MAFFKNEQKLARSFLSPAIPCNETINGSSGFLSSPGFPEYYDRNLNCNWIIDASNDGSKEEEELDEGDYQLKIKFDTFAVVKCC